ncbi:hypothetical protein [Lysobacter enzymogenes]|uniref:hypothetical protein n=1 Tax=Lysobacter enzymogenes TaxID=69 RepID=UPI001AF20DBF|nr:hypothetical protein [Lysobacter enzymogenes]QQQ00454.1 hypothetical protein JHW41_20570 [Lysobacter enzymogenes]
MTLRTLVATAAVSAALFTSAAHARTVRFDATSLVRGNTEAAALANAKQAAVNACTAQGGSVAGQPSAKIFRVLGTDQGGGDFIVTSYEATGSVACTKEVPDGDNNQTGNF